MNKLKPMYWDITCKRLFFKPDPIYGCEFLLIKSKVLIIFMLYIGKY